MVAVQRLPEYTLLTALLLGLREESADHGAADPFDLADVVDDQPSDALHQPYGCPDLQDGLVVRLESSSRDLRTAVSFFSRPSSVGTRINVAMGRRKLSNR